MRMRGLGVVGAVLLLGACALRPMADSPVPLVPQVDLARYAGDWYLVAHIPTRRDRGAHNAVENYRVNADGRIAITYENRLGGFEGKPKRMTPIAEVVEGTGNALWGVRFGWYWPFWYEYRIAHLEPDYSAAIVARSKRDFLWIFSRSPQLSVAQQARYEKLIASWGYDPARLEPVPQRRPPG